MDKLSDGTMRRLERIAELRGWKELTLIEEIERAIAIAWLTVENRNDGKRE